MDKKLILVTGGAGFIGSHLCKRLLKLNNKVLCLDNLFTGNKNNLLDIINNEDFEFINHDITKSFFYKDRINQIYNLSCPASPIHYQLNPIKTIKTCTIGVINILGLAKKHQSKILQASTSEIYGDPKIHPQNESYFGNVNPIGPRSCYDEGKRCSESLFMDYYREHNLRIKIARIFNTFGPNMSINDGRVVSNFINQAIKNDDISVYGDGNQTRSFLYIDCLIDGLIKLMDSEDNFIGPVNLGSPKEITIIKLAKMIINFTNSSSKVIFKSLPQDDPKRRNPDISLAKDKLNWVPQNDLEFGLKNTINFFKKIYK